MNLVDTHCHIQSIGTDGGERITRQIWAKQPELTKQSVVKAAENVGVTRLICVGCDLEDSRLAIDCAAGQSHCWASIGIHPHEAKHYAGQTRKLAEFSKLADQPKVVAVGECGLDFYYDHSPKAAQIEVLGFQINLAVEHDLPLIFHVRDAFTDFWPVFDSFKQVKGVLHSYTDSAENLVQALERGLYIGVNGIATFTKNQEQLSVYKNVPADRLVLETDAPFLAPVPFRGKINQPKLLTATADFLAELRGVGGEVLAEATTANARKLFKI